VTFQQESGYNVVVVVVVVGRELGAKRDNKEERRKISLELGTSSLGRDSTNIENQFPASGSE
jgi:hypothetical protein